MECQRALFDIPAQVNYLNTAYFSPQLKSVTEAGRRAVEHKEQPWNITIRDFFDGTEKSRQLLAAFIDASPDDIALIPSASYGIAVAAANIDVRSDEQIIVLADQFPSNVYSWRELAEANNAEVVTVTLDDHDSWGDAVCHAINGRTRVVSVPAAHWTDGRVVDLHAIVARVREVGAALVLDLSQSLGAMPFSIDDIRPDFMVVAGYKWLLCPYNTGFLYVNPGYHNGRPIEHNWINRQGSDDFARLVDYQDGFQDGARRFDVGERWNMILTPMVNAGLEQVSAWGVDAVAAYLGELTARFVDGAAALGLPVPPAAQGARHFVGANLPPGVATKLRETLSDMNIFVGVRGDAVRVAPYLHSTAQDIDALLEVLTAVL